MTTTAKYTRFQNDMGDDIGNDIVVDSHNRTVDRLDRCIITLDETNRIGNDTLDTLDSQTETINSIKNKSSSIQPKVEQSGRVIKTMTMRHKKNEIIQYIILLFLFIIATIMIILISTKK